MGNPPTHARGVGMRRVGKSNPYPYPSVPYPQPTWVSIPLTIPRCENPRNLKAKAAGSENLGVASSAVK